MLTISIAPMMDHTDRHCRYLMRLISREVILYTEMITSQAILRGQRERLLDFHPAEHPVVLQVGGSEPGELAECVKIATDWGYDAINLNVGCPSDRVQQGKFGACLMNEPELVAECIAKMQAATHLPITIKTRLGVDHNDSYEALTHFIRLNQQAGCNTFIVHARKAWLKGLSPKENREIPPLQYETVYQLKRDFPSLEIILNGGVRTTAEIAQHMHSVDGVMIGRAACDQPYLLAEIAQRFFHAAETPTQYEIVQRYLAYMHLQLTRGERLWSMSRHLLGLFRGEARARLWRRAVTERSRENNIHAIAQLIEQYI